MMYVSKWDLNGEQFTLDELVNMSNNIPKRTLAERLNNGWDVEVAIQTPATPKMISQDAADLYASGSIDVCFTSYIPGVLQQMQPVLNKVYTAEPHCAGRVKQKAKLYYTITLDNGKTLIVYPGEFVQVNCPAKAA